MIMTRTPVRVSFLGGGTDFPGWYKNHGGLVVGGAIDKYSFVTARWLPPFHGYKSRLVYSSIETVQDTREIQHRAIKACLEHFLINEKGVEVTHISDLPGRTGTGSSSTFVVGLLNALASLKGIALHPHQLADTATMIEREVLGETVGSQDQAWASNGGLAYIRFGRDGSVNFYPLALSSNDVSDLESHLLLYYTGVTRTSSDVSCLYAPQLTQDAKYQWAMMRMADQGVDALLKKDWQSLGVLMDRAWFLKRSLPGVTNTEIDRLYNIGRMAGATGGKLLGAGGGGCLLFLAPHNKVKQVQQAMDQTGMVRVNFKFDFGGSRVVFVDRSNLNG